MHALPVSVGYVTSHAINAPMKKRLADQSINQSIFIYL